MIRICPVSIPWFGSKNSGKLAKFAPEFAPVEFSKKRVSSCPFSKSGQIQPCLLRRVSSYVDMLSVRFPSVGGVKKIGRLKMFLVRFPTAGGVKKIGFFSKCSWFDSQLRRNPKTKNSPASRASAHLYSGEFFMNPFMTKSKLLYSTSIIPIRRCLRNPYTVSFFFLRSKTLFPALSYGVQIAFRTGLFSP